jgi:hypothetical protein
MVKWYSPITVTWTHLCAGSGEDVFVPFSRAGLAGGSTLNKGHTSAYDLGEPWESIRGKSEGEVEPQQADFAGKGEPPVL